ncbi:MAG: DUF5711 family protein [Oscillospiraceae bacterium]|nr:DUF5711 family protein [Oscillospiraceae bacterium]
MFNIIDKDPALKTKKIQVKKIVIILILSIIIVFLAVCVIIYQKNDSFRNFVDYSIFRKEVLSENTVKIPLSNLDISNVYAYNKNIVILNKNLLGIYNSFGQDVKDLEITISNPVFADNNKFLAVAEKGGSKIYLINNQNIVWQKDLDGSINNIVVNKNGYVSVSEVSTGYKTVVILYDPAGNELFKTYFPNTYAINMDISSDNKYLSIAEVNVNGTIIQTDIKVILIETAKSDPQNAILGPYNSNSTNIISNIKYQDKNILISMYDNAIYKTGDNMDKLKDITSDVIFADIEATNDIVTVEKNSEGLFKTSYVLEMLNIFTNKITKYNLSNLPQDIYTKDTVVAVNYGTEAEFVATNGWLIKTYMASGDIKGIVMASGIAGVICKDNVEIVNL